MSNPSAAESIVVLPLSLPSPPMSTTTVSTCRSATAPLRRLTFPLPLGLDANWWWSLSVEAAGYLWGRKNGIVVGKAGGCLGGRLPQTRQRGGCVLPPAPVSTAFE